MRPHSISKIHILFYNQTKQFRSNHHLLKEQSNGYSADKANLIFLESFLIGLHACDLDFVRSFICARAVVCPEIVSWICIQKPRTSGSYSHYAEKEKERDLGSLCLVELKDVSCFAVGISLSFCFSSSFMLNSIFLVDMI